MNILEILIAVFILSLCLLGIAGVQVNAVQRNQDAYWRSLAALQVESMIESENAGDYNCSIWQAACAKLLPHGQGKCASKISVCWQGKMLGKECIAI